MDLFASEYGWSKESILDQMGFDEALQLQGRIKLRVYAEYRMQLAITQNPHTKEPEDLWKLLNDNMKQLQTADMNTVIDDGELDRQGLDDLKNLMSGGTAFVVK